VLTGLLAAIIWASNGLRAALGAEFPSARALFTSLALILTGFTVGILLGFLATYARARRRSTSVDSAVLTDLATSNVLSALMVLGLVTALTLDTAMGVPEWVLLLVGSFVGGLLVGVAFTAVAEQGRRTVGHPSGVQPPTPYDWQ
jgi:hypothetical protein